MGKRMNKWLLKREKMCLAVAREAEININSANAPFIPNSVPEKPWHSGLGYMQWLSKRGYTRIGSGAYSGVYAKGNSTKVIRITAGSQDDWIDYIQWAAKKGYCGNFAPRVYSWKKYPAGFSVSVVERMEYTLKDKEAGDVKLVECLMYSAIHQKSLMAQVYIDDLVPGLVPFLSDLTGDFSTNDIYGKNMMLRKDGSFCVTDPVCGRSRTTLNRLRSSDLKSLTPIGYYIEGCNRYRS